MAALSAKAVNKLFYRRLGFTPNSVSHIRIPYCDSTSLARLRSSAGVIIQHLKAPIRAKRRLQNGIRVVQSKHPPIYTTIHNFKRMGYSFVDTPPECP